MNTIRPEARGDVPAIREAVRAAVPTDAEMRLVDALREKGDIAASLVCEADGFIVGHAVLSRMNVFADGRPVAAAALGPVSVLPECQSEGIGTRLIRDLIEQARGIGFQMIFVLGDPAYYGRFGFDAPAAKPYRSAYSGENFMALELDAPPRPFEGSADYAAPFGNMEG